METITTLADLIACGDMQGKRIFIRADLNVPFDDAGQITDDTRIRASLPAIRQCLDAGASVMITSHLGRPIEGDPSPRDSLAPVCRRMSALLGRDVRMLANWSGGGFAVPPGQIVMLENCRLNVGESRNSETLARAIASLCDIYVNDAFGTAHRKEATTYGVAQYAPVVCAGPLMAAEIDALHSALDAPRRPLTAIVAGSKVSTKLTILQSLASKVDQLIVGGGIANTFMLAAGLPIGRSLAEPALVEEARRIIDLMQARGAAVPIPEDVVVAKRFAADADARVVDATEVADDDLILDIGPRTAERLGRLISAAGTVVWNGPMGVFEIEQFGNGTRALAHAIAESDAFSVAGGGDTLAAIAKYGIEDRIDYISTGGGAFLELLEGKELPALAILAHRTALSMVAPEHEPL